MKYLIYCLIFKELSSNIMQYRRIEGHAGICGFKSIKLRWLSAGRRSTVAHHACNYNLFCFLFSMIEFFVFVILIDDYWSLYLWCVCLNRFPPTRVHLIGPYNVWCESHRPRACCGEHFHPATAIINSFNRSAHRSNKREMTWPANHRLGLSDRVRFPTLTLTAHNIQWQ